jgi:hypothetical protein
MNTDEDGSSRSFSFPYVSGQLGATRGFNAGNQVADEVDRF